VAFQGGGLALLNAPVPHYFALSCKIAQISVNSWSHISPPLSRVMSSKQQLTDKSLIDLLEKQRVTFTDRYLPLRTVQETALRKANELVAKPPEALKRNYSKKKANAILNDIKNCISYDVFVLCALATNLSALGTSKLGNYVSKISLWWEGVHHPKGLTEVSERYGTRISNVSPNDKLTSDELPSSSFPHSVYILQLTMLCIRG
jgi:hypothetical protein